MVSNPTAHEDRLQVHSSPHKSVGTFVSNKVANPIASGISDPGSDCLYDFSMNK